MYICLVKQVLCRGYVSRVYSPLQGEAGTPNPVMGFFLSMSNRIREHLLLGQMPWGSFEGSKIEDLPTKYLYVALSNFSLDTELRCMLSLELDKRIDQDKHISKQGVIAAYSIMRDEYSPEKTKTTLHHELIVEFFNLICEQSLEYHFEKIKLKSKRGKSFKKKS
jgi:uncharacterized protein (DUF3820 family)